MKFEDAYYDYFAYAQIKQKKQSLITLNYRFCNKIMPFFKNFNIYNITDNDYLNWQKYINVNFDYSNNYKSGLHYIMCGFFDYCVNFLGLKYNIARKVGNFRLLNIKTTHNIYTLKEF